MSSSSLRNYLRSNRKRLGLTQDEIAFLLGAKSGAKISRYEQFIREPNLETALAFEAVLQKPVKELFAGVYDRVAEDVRKRAKILFEQLKDNGTNRQNAMKRSALLKIMGPGFFDE